MGLASVRSRPVCLRIHRALIRMDRPRQPAASCHAGAGLQRQPVLGFSDNRYYQFKRLADDADRLPVLREAVEAGEIGRTKAQQRARVGTEAMQAARAGRLEPGG